MAGTGLHVTYQTQLTDVWPNTVLNNIPVATKNKDDLGTLRYEDGRTYKVMRASANSGILAGDVVFWKTDDFPGRNANPSFDAAVTRQATTSNLVLAGVAMADFPSTTSRGWFQIKGFVSLGAAHLAAEAVDNAPLMADITGASRLTRATASVVVTAADHTAHGALTGSGTHTLATPVHLPPIHAVCIDKSEGAVFLMCPE